MNSATSKYIFDDIIKPAITSEIHLEVQHCRATLNVRRAFDIISSKVVIINKSFYLSRLAVMLKDTRILPGKTMDMLTKRIDLIFKATAKLSETSMPPDSEFILHMIRITGLSTSEFDSISYKINRNTGIVYDRTTVIAMFTQHLQHITCPPIISAMFPLSVHLLVTTLQAPEHPTHLPFGINHQLYSATNRPPLFHANPNLSPAPAPAHHSFPVQFHLSTSYPSWLPPKFASDHSIPLPIPPKPRVITQ